MADPSEPLRATDQDLYFQLFEFAPDALLVFDEQGNVKQANARTEEAFGYPRSEMIGRPVTSLVPMPLSPSSRTELPGIGIRKDGTEFPIDIMLSPVETKDGQVIVAALRNSKERPKTRELAEQVSRSATLLKEVHHRVKNNLQIISSLLYLRSVQDANPAVTRVLQECQARVRSIALIHEKLYRSPIYGKLNFADYISDFVAELIRTYEVPGERVQVKTRLEPTHMGMDTVLPCALILHELVSNVFLHAFQGRESGEVHVELGVDQGRYVLTVRDNGVGMPDLRQASASLGLTLVRDLVTQLRGQLEIEVSDGTRVRVTFSEIDQSRGDGSV
jgi:PAS domain S-box-containing protein